jgi:hypothetical protein
MLDPRPEFIPLGQPSSTSSGHWRVFAAFLVLGCFILGATLAAAVLYARHVVETTVFKVARVADVRLRVGEIRWGLGFIQVFDAHLEFIRVPGVTVDVRRLDLDFAGTTVKKVLVSGIDVRAVGDPQELYRDGTRELARWRSVELPGTTKTARPEMEYRELGVDWQGNLPLVSHARLENVRWTETPLGAPDAGETELVLKATRGLVGTVEWSPFAIVYRTQTAGFDLAFGETFATAKWSVSYREAADGPVAVLGFTSVDLADLMSRADSAPVPEALAKARADGVLTAQLDPATLKVLGKLTARLTGFVPPHPPELKGYAFKDTTRLDVTFTGDPLLNVADLSVIQLVNGDIALLGNGRVERTSEGAKIRADLSTHLDCITLAKGFAATEVGGALGAWGQKNAAKALRGSVAVRVQLDADTEHLAEAKVVKRIGIGCGLRPLTLEELLSLGLPPPPEPKTIERIVKQLPRADRLPKLPSLLPSLDELLDVNLRRK